MAFRRRKTTLQLPTAVPSVFVPGIAPAGECHRHSSLGRVERDEAGSSCVQNPKKPGFTPTHVPRKADVLEDWTMFSSGPCTSSRDLFWEEDTPHSPTSGPHRRRRSRPRGASPARPSPRRHRPSSCGPAGHQEKKGEMRGEDLKVLRKNLHGP